MTKKQKREHKFANQLRACNSLNRIQSGKFTQSATRLTVQMKEAQRKELVKKMLPPVIAVTS